VTERTYGGTWPKDSSPPAQSHTSSPKSIYSNHLPIPPIAQPRSYSSNQKYKVSTDISREYERRLYPPIISHVGKGDVQLYHLVLDLLGPFLRIEPDRIVGHCTILLLICSLPRKHLGLLLYLMTLWLNS
jgi:hypothetical protein